MNAYINQVIKYTIKQARKDGSVFVSTIDAKVFSIGSFIKCRPLEAAIDNITGIEIIGLNDVININSQFFTN